MFSERRYQRCGREWGTNVAAGRLYFLAVSLHATVSVRAEYIADTVQESLRMPRTLCTEKRLLLSLMCNGMARDGVLDFTAHRGFFY